MDSERLRTEFFRNRAEGQLALVSSVIRAAGGAVFVYNGVTKFIELPWTTSQFRMMGFPATSAIPFFVALLETIGGLLLFVGLATRLVAALLGLEMIVACLATLGIMHGRILFLLLPFLMLVLTGFVLWAGPSAYALDTRLANWSPGPRWHRLLSWRPKSGAGKAGQDVPTGPIPTPPNKDQPGYRPPPRSLPGPRNRSIGSASAPPPPTTQPPGRHGR
ncbi:MAG TPA: DoxX family membrane protein [Pseudonocardia sp.]|jgi:uncharacterized membrane protein YphA (DoxX/SURF4 family)